MNLKDIGPLLRPPMFGSRLVIKTTCCHCWFPIYIYNVIWPSYNDRLAIKTMFSRFAEGDLISEKLL